MPIDFKKLLVGSLPLRALKQHKDILGLGQWNQIIIAKSNFWPICLTLSLMDANEKSPVLVNFHKQESFAMYKYPEQLG